LEANAKAQALSYARALSNSEVDAQAYTFSYTKARSNLEADAKAYTWVHAKANTIIWTSMKMENHRTKFGGYTY